MANVIYMRCRHCGELLHDREREYCPSCNLYLAYRAMPLILGMLLLPAAPTRLAHLPVKSPSQRRAATWSYDDESFLSWE